MSSIALGAVGGRSLCVGRLPDRARPVLYLTEGATIHVLASFNSLHSANLAIAFIEDMANKNATVSWDTTLTPNSEVKP